jgi:hypothetical protein
MVHKNGVLYLKHREICMWIFERRVVNPRQRNLNFKQNVEKYFTGVLRIAVDEDYCYVRREATSTG